MQLRCQPSAVAFAAPVWIGVSTATIWPVRWVRACWTVSMNVIGRVAPRIHVWCISPSPVNMRFASYFSDPHAPAMRQSAECRYCQPTHHGRTRHKRRQHAVHLGEILNSD